MTELEVLRERVDVLQEQVKQLRAVITGYEHIDPSSWVGRLPHCLRETARALLQHEYCTTAMLNVAIYGEPNPDQSPETIRVHISRLRKKLAADLGVVLWSKINNGRGFYFIEADDKRKVKDA